MSDKYEAPFPHCDPRVLHAPGKCVYCDGYPKLQAERESGNVAFTGEDLWPEDGSRVKPKSPCPAELVRPVGTIHRWPGNRPQTQADVEEHARRFKELMAQVGFPEKEDSES